MHTQEFPDLTHGRIVSTPITREDLSELAKEQFGDWIKAVVDVSRGVMAAGGDLHADDEALLLAEGSRQRNLWGINLYPEERGDDWIARLWNGSSWQRLTCRAPSTRKRPVGAGPAEGLRKYFFGFSYAARMLHYRRQEEVARYAPTATDRLRAGGTPVPRGRPTHRPTLRTTPGSDQFGLS